MTLRSHPGPLFRFITPEYKNQSQLNALAMPGARNSFEKEVQQQFDPYPERQLLPVGNDTQESGNK
jgi:hypothetical protein